VSFFHLCNTLEEWSTPLLTAISFYIFAGVIYYNFDWEELWDLQKAMIVVAVWAMITMHLIY